MAKLTTHMPTIHLFFANVSTLWSNSSTNNWRFQRCGSTWAWLWLRINYWALFTKPCMTWHITGMSLTIKFSLTCKLAWVIFWEQRIFCWTTFCITIMLTTQSSFLADCITFKLLFCCFCLKALYFPVNCWTMAFLDYINFTFWTFSFMTHYWTLMSAG